MCRFFGKGQQLQKLLIGLILTVNYCDGFISTVDIRRLMETIILLPTVIKGTDSRVGLGFHLGRHADIQTIVEVGPQKFTKPLENPVENSSNAGKRMIKQFSYSNVVKKQPNQYGSSYEWKNDISPPEIYLKEKSFKTINQFPLPYQPIDLTIHKIRT